MFKTDTIWSSPLPILDGGPTHVALPSGGSGKINRVCSRIGNDSGPGLSTFNRLTRPSPAPPPTLEPPDRTPRNAIRETDRDYAVPPHHRTTTDTRQ